MKIGGRLKSEIFVDVVGRKVLRAAAAAVRSCEGEVYAFDLRGGRRVKGLAHKDLPHTGSGPGRTEATGLDPRCSDTFGGSNASILTQIRMD